MLPIFQTQNKDLTLLQTNWAKQLNPVLSNDVVNGQLLENVTIINGVTAINHLLSRQMIGWYITDINAAATIYRSAPLNDKTLTLVSNADAVISLWVF